MVATVPFAFAVFRRPKYQTTARTATIAAAQKRIFFINYFPAKKPARLRGRAFPKP
jgi:hypothetical protein